MTQIVLSALLVTTLAGCAGNTIKRFSNDGVKKQVFDWAFWSQSCTAADFTIKVTKPPEFGVVEIGTGTMVIGRESATGARMACEGKTVANKVVYYTANDGYKGVDTIGLSIVGRNAAPRLFTLEVQVY
ncbi:hypothetical protein [Granulosicoccus antarcticus]|uniref:hypothetical protein n=1 Tax=Granulosicoccus antarcticus TaxID=437505 RepID=UPI0012FD3BEE|nr:hypothetical protein [Granulosicoccus antarcticus]